MNRLYRTAAAITLSLLCGYAASADRRVKTAAQRPQASALPPAHIVKTADQRPQASAVPPAHILERARRYEMISAGKVVQREKKLSPKIKLLPNLWPKWVSGDRSQDAAGTGTSSLWLRFYNGHYDVTSGKYTNGIPTTTPTTIKISISWAEKLPSGGWTSPTSVISNATYVVDSGFTGDYWINHEFLLNIPTHLKVRFQGTMSIDEDRQVPEYNESDNNTFYAINLPCGNYELGCPLPEMEGLYTDH